MLDTYLYIILLIIVCLLRLSHMSIVFLKMITMSPEADKITLHWLVRTSVRICNSY